MSKTKPKSQSSDNLQEPDISSADQNNTVSESEFGVIVNSPFVCVHEYPSDTSPVLDYLEENSMVQILNEIPGFYAVEYGRARLTGFVSFNFCRRVGSGYGRF